MRIAETVTFGGSGLDRAAHLRGDAAATEGMLRDPAARVLPVWRGKPLFAGEPRDLGWLAPGHAALSPADEAPVFLGLDGGPRFAVDISGWQPEEVPDTVGAASPSTSRDGSPRRCPTRSARSSTPPNSATRSSPRTMPSASFAPT